MSAPMTVATAFSSATRKDSCHWASRIRNSMAKGMDFYPFLIGVVSWNVGHQNKVWWGVNCGTDFFVSPMNGSCRYILCSKNA